MLSIFFEGLDQSLDAPFALDDDSLPNRVRRDILRNEETLCQTLSSLELSLRYRL